MKRTQRLINKPVSLGLSILQLSEMIMYDFWYDYQNTVKKQSSVT